MTYCTLSEGEGKQQSFICCCIFSTYAWTPYHCVMIKLVGSVTTHPGESEVWMTKLWSGISSCSRRGHVYSLFTHTDTADMPRCSSSLQVEIDNIKNAQGCYLTEVGCHRASFIHKSSVWGLTVYDWRVPHPRDWCYGSYSKSKSMNQVSSWYILPFCNSRTAV